MISTGTAYTYRVTATVQVKDANKNLRSWSNSAEVKATATGTKPAISVKSTKKGVATVSGRLLQVQTDMMFTVDHPRNPRRVRL